MTRRLIKALRAWFPNLNKSNMEDIISYDNLVLIDIQGRFEEDHDHDYYETSDYKTKREDWFQTFFYGKIILTFKNGSHNQGYYREHFNSMRKTETDLLKYLEDEHDIIIEEFYEVEELKGEGSLDWSKMKLKQYIPHRGGKVTFIYEGRLSYTDPQKIVDYDDGY